VNTALPAAALVAELPPDELAPEVEDDEDDPDDGAGLDDEPAPGTAL